MAEPVVQPWQDAGIGTDLYQRAIAFNTSDRVSAAIMLKVWTPTPWVVNANTGFSDLTVETWCTLPQIMR